MALTAREWLLLPEKEQQSRIKELSPHECYLLRTELECVCFTDEEKKRFPEEKKESFLYKKKHSKEEKEAFNLQCQEIFAQLSKEAKSEK